MSFWHFTLRIRKKQYRLWVVKVKFHVFTCYKNMKSGLCSFYSVSHFRIDQHRRTGRGSEGGGSPPNNWATQIFWAARENLGKASF